MVTKEQIVEMLKTNNKALMRALVVLNERQTADEQASQNTYKSNGEGFTPADAYMGTSMAIQITKWGKLSEKQIAYWRKPNAKGVPRICKYAGQLLEIAKAKAAKSLPKVVADDIGNLSEEYIVIQEVLSGHNEGAIQLPEERVEALYARLQQINEAVEEIKRSEYKMNRDFALAA